MSEYAAQSAGTDAGRVLFSPTPSTAGAGADPLQSVRDELFHLRSMQAAPSSATKTSRGFGRNKDLARASGSSAIPSASEVRTFIGNVVNLVTSTDPSAGDRLDDTEDLVTLMHQTVLVLRDLCRGYANQRTQIAQLLLRKSECDRVLALAAEFSNDKLLADVSASHARVQQLEGELASKDGEILRLATKQLELEGELQLMQPAAEGGLGAGRRASVRDGRRPSQLANGAGAHDADVNGNPLATLVRAQETQSAQIKQMLEALGKNQQDIARLSAQLAPGGANGAKPAGGEAAMGARSRGDSSDRESFDDDASASSEGEATSASNPSPSSGQSKAGATFRRVANVARAGAMMVPQMRRRHGMTMSLQVNPSSDVGSKRSSNLNLFEDPADKKNEFGVPSYMANVVSSSPGPGDPSAGRPSIRPAGAPPPPPPLKALQRR